MDWFADLIARYMGGILHPTQPTPLITKTMMSGLSCSDRPNLIKPDDFPEPGSFEPEDDWTEHRFGSRGAAP